MNSRSHFCSPWASPFAISSSPRHQSVSNCLVAALLTGCLMVGLNPATTLAGQPAAAQGGMTETNGGSKMQNSNLQPSPVPASILHSPSLPTQVDLRPEFERWQLPRWHQGSRPTCSAFTVTGALEFAIAKQQGHGTRLSVEFLNWASNRRCGDAQDGGFFSDLWKGFATYGICTAGALPYAGTFDPAAAPSPEALANAKTRRSLRLQLQWIKEWDVNTGLTDAHLIGIKKTLAAGWPVCSGSRWPKEEKWIDDVMQLCPPDAVRDGHSVLLVGYRDEPAQPGGGVFIFRNTSKTGRDGFMPYAYAQAYMNDAAWIDFAPQEKPQASVSTRATLPPTP